MSVVHAPVGSCIGHFCSQRYMASVVLSMMTKYGKHCPVKIILNQITLVASETNCSLPNPNNIQLHVW